MEIKKLSKDIVEKTRSSFTVNSIPKCILELVANSIDANANAIAIRINLINFRFQVVDNGIGIAKDDLKNVGFRYMTNKCNSLNQLEKLVTTHGFRGESLASIANMCRKITISSRIKDSNKTYTKIIENGKHNKIEQVKDRPSVGATVTVEGFFNKLPVRQKRVIKEIELEDIRKHIEYLIIIHPEISFSLRDDTTGALLITSHKQTDIIGSFLRVHPDIDDNFVLLKVSKHKITVEGLMHKKGFKNRNLQYMYCNKKPIMFHKIQKIICTLYHKNIVRNKTKKDNNKYPIFVVNVKCPHSYVDIGFNPSKTIVEFKHFDVIEHCIEKMINSYFGNNNVPPKNNVNKIDDYKSTYGISQVNGAVQACGFKRKQAANFTNVLPNKSSKIPLENPRVSSENMVSVENTDNEENILEEDEECDKTNCIPCIKQKGTEDTPPMKKSKPFVKTPFVRDKTIKQTQATSGNYIIEDSGQSEYKRKISGIHKGKYKKPLPISILKNIEISPRSQVDLKQRENNIELNEDRFYSKSVYSALTNDEDKGKNLIMNMFLKSTQVFNGDAKSVADETIQESNFFAEKNVQDHVRGFNTTMSISVNVKRTKINPKHINNHNEYDNEQLDKGCLKTSKLSKGVQTTFIDNGIRKIENALPTEAIADNYTVVMSNTASENPRFKYVRKQVGKSVKKLFEMKNEQERTCECNRSRFFNFKRLKSADEKSICNKVNKKLTLISQPTSSLENLDISPIRTSQDKPANCQKELNVPNNNVPFYPVNIQDNMLYQHPGHYCVPPQNLPIHPMYFNIPIPEHQMMQNNMYSCPYLQQHYPVLINISNFLDKHQNNLRQPFEAYHQAKNDNNILPSYSFFDPQFRSTQNNNGMNNNNYRPLLEERRSISDVYDYNMFEENVLLDPLFSNNEVQQPLLEISKSNHGLKNVSPSLFSNANLFFLENQRNCSNDLLATENNLPPDKSNLFSQLDPIASLTNLVVSQKEKKKLLEEGIKETILKNNNIAEEKILSASGNISPREKSRIIMDSQNQWIRKFNSTGKAFYINQRTGIGTFVPPKRDSNLFQFEKRLQFVPLGYSPILKGHKPVDKIMSQTAKTKLQSFIMESYENELLVIKWENYIDNDPKTFFETLYLAKTKLYESCVPNASNNYLTKGKDNIVSFDKSLFNNIEIVGQVDKKFIAVVEKNKNMLILFDQHAVHERIRLEILLEEYKEKTEVCEEKLIIFVPPNDLSLLRKYENYLTSFGLEVEFFTNGLNVLKIPSCLHHKFNSDSLNEAVNALLKEIIDWLKFTRGTTLAYLPKVIQNAINLEACRGAIKFGDKLTKADCEVLIQQLVFCKLPFQCAHGRPTLTPLLTLQDNEKKKDIMIMHGSTNNSRSHIELESVSLPSREPRRAEPRLTSSRDANETFRRGRKY